jgi:uncharacterized protein
MFEWDDDKRRRNLEKHGIDFEDVLPVFGSHEAIAFEDNRKDYGEARRILLCRFQQSVLHVAYTVRGDVVRIISVRRASRRERRAYGRRRAD